MKIAFTFWTGKNCNIPPKRYGGFERILYYLSVELPKLTDCTCYCYPQCYPHWKFWTTNPKEIPVEDYDAILNISNARFECPHVVNYEWGYGHTKNVVVPSRKESEIRHKPNKVVYFGTDVDYYRFNPNKEDYFIFFARIHPSKGPQVALEIAKRTGIKLKIMGEDKQKPFVTPELEVWIRNFRKACNQVPNVEYLGAVSNEDVVKYLGKAKAMLYPITGAFMFDLTVIEALSCGTPVIVSNKPAPNELVENGKTGFICSDINDFIRAIGRIDSLDPRTVRKVAEEKWSSRRMARELVGLLEQVSRGETW